MPRGNFGEIRAFQDFLGSYEDVTWSANADIDLNVAMFAGFMETMVLATPVMAAEYASTTMTINGSGGVAGLQYDLDGTNPDVFRPASGDGGAVTGTNKSGTAITATTTTSSGQTVTADAFVVARVEISPSGRIDYLLAADKELTLVESITGAVTASDLFYAVLMLENREAAAKEFEVDYVYARGFRDWTA